MELIVLFIARFKTRVLGFYSQAQVYADFHIIICFCMKNSKKDNLSN